MRSASPLQGVLPRASARLRVTVLLAAIVLGAGAAIVGTILMTMTYLPSYDIVGASPGTGGPTAPQGSVAIEATALGIGGLLAVTGAHEILLLLLTTSLVALGVVLVAGVGVGWVVAGRILRPVEQITEAAELAASGSLDHRIGLAGPDDEFRRLARTFDAMLGRLDAAMQAQRRFSANASHELRTPLATTQAVLDVALLDPPAVDVAELVRRLRETNTRNIATVEALLSLADAQSGAIDDVPVDLAAISREVVASNRSDAGERGVALHPRIDDAELSGDPTLIRLMVSNLVGNAVRYSYSGGDVWITVCGRRLLVANSGPDIADVERLTEPFFRAAGRVDGAHGLGLALVAAIADAHGAALSLAPRRGGGLEAEVVFA